MTKTRGVFALITEGKKLLLSERMDGKGWNLPGGRVEEGETDQVALVREVEEETGLKVEVLHRVGPDHVFNDDTAVAYLCKVVGGELKLTAEAKNHAWVNAQEVRQGNIHIPGQEFDMEAPQNDVNIPLKLVGPEGRLGRTGRMIWDAFSVMESVIHSHKFGTTEWQPRPITDYEVSRDGLRITMDNGERILIWDRLDPYSPTGKIQPK